MVVPELNETTTFHCIFRRSGSTPFTNVYARLFTDYSNHVWTAEGGDCSLAKPGPSLTRAQQSGPFFHTQVLEVLRWENSLHHCLQAIESSQSKYSKSQSC